MPEGEGGLISSGGKGGMPQGKPFIPTSIPSTQERQGVLRGSEGAKNTVEGLTPQPKASEATGPEAANSILRMATKGPETGLRQLAQLDLAQLDKKAANDNEKPEMAYEKPAAETVATNRQTKEGVTSAETPKTEANQEITGTPAPGMDLDPRYTAIRKQVVEQWKQTHPGKDVFAADA